jgi:hypothetical protein
LPREPGLDAAFVRADVYDARRVLEGKFEIVFVSWGSLNRLLDIWRWSEVVAAMLAPGGYLYLVEQHPFITMMSEVNGALQSAYGWRTPHDRPVVTDTPTAYNDDPTPLVHPRMHERDHPLFDVIGALLTAGLRLDFLHEHEVLPWRRLPMMVPVTDRPFRLPDTQSAMPLSFSLKASMPSSGRRSGTDFRAAPLPGWDRPAGWAAAPPHRNPDFHFARKCSMGTLPRP